MTERAIGDRIVVIGTTGAGKTTMAGQLSSKFGIPHIEIDSLFWKPDWGETPDDEFLPKVERATRGDRWVIDGNYSRTRSIVWRRAETVVWLDYRFSRIFWQLLRRTLRRCATREELWENCYEGFRRAVVSRESILLWAVKTYARRRRNLSSVLADPAYGHLVVYRFRTPRQARAWFDSLAGHTNL